MSSDSEFPTIKTALLPLLIRAKDVCASGRYPRWGMVGDRHHHVLVQLTHR